jgi:hypothetical protein
MKSKKENFLFGIFSEKYSQIFKVEIFFFKKTSQGKQYCFPKRELAKIARYIFLKKKRSQQKKI